MASSRGLSRGWTGTCSPEHAEELRAAIDD